MSTPSPVQELLDCLRLERQGVDLVIYRHQVCLLLVAAADLAHLTLATDDLLDAEEHLSLLGLRRSIAVAELAARWRCGSDASLAELAAAAPDPLDGELLDAQRTSLRDALDEAVVLRRRITELGGALLPVLGERQDRLVSTFGAAFYRPPS